MKAVLVLGERAGFLFSDKREYRLFMKEMKEKVKAIKPKSKDFSVLFPITDVEFLDKNGFVVSTKKSP